LVPGLCPFPRWFDQALGERKLPPCRNIEAPGLQLYFTHQGDNVAPGRLEKQASRNIEARLQKGSVREKKAPQFGGLRDGRPRLVPL